ncbi:MAG: VWA domain-containing protein [Planctomycetes bacterium]|nr:VWA domain-containing protein [Planctomycetota bacterium]
MNSVATAARVLHEPGHEPRRVDRSIVYGLASGGSSMAVHLALLLVLGLMVTPTVPRPQVTIVESSFEEIQPQEEITQRLPESVDPARSLTFDDSRSSPMPKSEAVRDAIGQAVAAPKMAASASVVQNLPPVDVGVVSMLTRSSGELMRFAPEEANGQPLASAENIGEALDRITQEILNRLAKRKVLVVWMFDQSESMQDDRAEIAARVHRVYEELKLSAAADGDALATSVMSFGANTALHTPQPTSDINKIQAAIAAVPNDPSGHEMMCRALTTAITQHQKFADLGKRQLMIVLVTDESGDMATNHAELESTIATAKAARCPVYVLGREAVFGYPYAHLRWIDPETKIGFWLRIDRGPESPQPEQLQVDGIHRRHDAHPSGFGPYEQSRLARQTGGVFFLLPSPESNLVRRDDRRYDPDAMRPYLPDLSARPDYAAERDKHPMRAVLWKVITDLNPYAADRADLVQVRLWDWPIEREAFAREAARNVAKAEQLIGYFAAAERELAKVRPMRDRDPSLRWRANFDTTYAQTIAYQARLKEYVAYIKAFVETPKAIRNELGPARPTNRWDGHYVKRTLVNDAAAQQQRYTATRLFQQTIADHPGTPWAARAEYELARGFGLELREDYEDPRRGSVKIPTP